MHAGTIVVAKANVPKRFKNITAGTFWKVLQNNGRTIVVGDQYFPKGITTKAGYFEVLDGQHQSAILNSGNTHLAGRLRAIRKYQPRLGNGDGAGYGHVKVEVNGNELHFARGVAEALAAKDSKKLLQSKLRKAL